MSKARVIKESQRPGKPKVDACQPSIVNPERGPKTTIVGPDPEALGADLELRASPEARKR